MGNLSSAIGKAAIAQEAEPKEEAGQLAVDHAVAKAEFKELEMNGVVYEFPSDMDDAAIGVALDKVHFESVGKTATTVEEDFQKTWKTNKREDKGDIHKGIWNNNPLNIEHKAEAFARDPWEGEAGIEGGREPRFSKFEKAEDSFRAATMILQKYNGRGQDTVDSIIFGLQNSSGKYKGGWAPPESKVDTNPSANYSSFVAKFMGVGRDQPLNMQDPSTLMKLMKGMTRFENGHHDPYTDLEYMKGIRRGLGLPAEEAVDTELIFENVMNLPDELLNAGSELSPGIYKNSAEEFFMVDENKKVRKLGFQDENEGDPERATDSAT